MPAPWGASGDAGTSSVGVDTWVDIQGQLRKLRVPIQPEVKDFDVTSLTVGQGQAWKRGVVSPLHAGT